MHQDATWYGGKPQPGDFVLDGDLASSRKRGRSPSIFGPCLLRPNGWMDQDGTWRGGGPWSRPHCVTWGPSSPQKGHSPQFSAHVYYGQTAVCIRIPHGVEIGLSLGDIVLNGDPAPPPLKGHSPNFDQCLLWPNGWMD